MSTEEPSDEPAMVYLGDLTMVDVAQLDHPILARALHRVLADMDRSDDLLARFESSI